jgi:AraC-like DNA-binding protein
MENRAAVGGGDQQMTMYHIDTPVEAVPLRAPHPMYYGVVEGEAVVRAEEGDVRTCGTGQSLVVPPLQSVQVGFPAARDASVTYVALQIDQESVRDILERINENALDTSNHRRWRMEENTFCHVDHQEGINRVLSMIRYLFRSDPPNRDRLIDLNTRELLIQMLQTRSRPLLVGEFSRHTSTGGLAAAVQYIQQNLDRHISVDELVEEACMSKSTFYRHFSDEFDMSPLEYISQERVLRARELLSDPENTVTGVSHALGFSSTSHFIDMFKEHEGVTPKQYQLDVIE